MDDEDESDDEDEEYLRARAFEISNVTSRQTRRGQKQARRDEGEAQSNTRRRTPDEAAEPQHAQGTNEVRLVAPEVVQLMDDTDGVLATRGLGLAAGTAELREGEYRLLAIGSGDVVSSSSVRFATQKAYAIGLTEGVQVCAHPSHDAWALANEPRPGEAANCAFYCVDINVEELTHETNYGDAAMLEETWVTVVALVQVGPCGPGGELTVHYGRNYGRQYEVGRDAPTHAPVDAEDFMRLAARVGLSPSATLQEVARFGAPEDDDAATICERARRADTTQRPRLQTASDAAEGVSKLPIRRVRRQSDERRAVKCNTTMASE